MPIIEITLIEGRPFEKKKRMMREVTDAVVAAIDVPREAVRIIIREVPPWHFSAAGVVKGEPEQASPPLPPRGLDALEE